MPAFAERTKETSTTTGTGSLTLAGASSCFQSFATALGSASIGVDYMIVGQTTTEWEQGEGIFNGTTGLTRDVVRASSNSNALVSFSSGTKDVILSPSAATLNNAGQGAALANARGWALP